jgi:predicted dehydrogenase
MAQKPIRVGLVGSGFVGSMHSLAYNNVTAMYWPELPAVERVRLFDVTPELAAAGAERLGWAEATDDWRKITRASDIDLVDIVTPNYAHAEIAIDAAQHGKHILCEKPLAHNVDSARQMYEAVQEAGCVNMVCFMYRTWPAAAFARQLIQEGKIGRILHFHARYLHEFAIDPQLPLVWRFQAHKAGTGSLGDVGSHAIDIARYLAGDIDRVMGRMQTFVDRRPLIKEGSRAQFFRSDDEAAPPPSEYGAVDVDDATAMLVEFADGAMGTIETNWMAAGHNNELSFEVSGDRGAIRFNWQQANELQVCLMDDPQNLHGYRTIPLGPWHPGAERFGDLPGLGAGYRDAFYIVLREALEAISNGRQAQPDFLDGLRTSEIIDAVVRSARSNEWVKVEHSPGER